MHDQVAAHKRRSALLCAGFALAVALGLVGVNLLIGGGAVGFVAAVSAAAVVTAVAYRRSADVVLAVSHARPADPVEHARLHNLVEGLCVAAGVPKPRIFVVDDETPNAFTVGRDARHAAVGVTTGLLGKLNRIELEAVLAHELSHVKNCDVMASTVAVTTVGLAALVADWALRFSSWDGPTHADDRRGSRGGAAVVLGAVGLVLLPLAALAARLLRLAVSPRREAVADLTGVSLTRYPPGLVSALEKVRAGGGVVRSGSRATAHLWLESPVARADSEGRLAWLGRLVDTHPPLEERIEALREL
ncbi:MAG: M48 family metalloprotease [Actinomycetota bacterium]|nr:M48 family metalloprotease [Actinomycetota bacterium]